MAHGIARLSRHYCCDPMRYRFGPGGVLCMCLCVDTEDGSCRCSPRDPGTPSIPVLPDLPPVQEHWAG